MRWAFLLMGLLVATGCCPTSEQTITLFAIDGTSGAPVNEPTFSADGVPLRAQCVRRANDAAPCIEWEVNSERVHDFLSSWHAPVLKVGEHTLIASAPGFGGKSERVRIWDEDQGSQCAMPTDETVVFVLERR